jgi:hypothetical protein
VDLPYSNKVNLVANAYELTKDVNDVTLYETLNPNRPVEKVQVTYGNITYVMSDSPLFDDYPSYDGVFNVVPTGSQRSILDACIIMAFNGYGGTGGHNFLYLTGNMNDGFVWNITDNQNDYVQKVTEQVVPSD